MKLASGICATDNVRYQAIRLERPIGRAYLPASQRHSVRRGLDLLPALAPQAYAAPAVAKRRGSLDFICRGSLEAAWGRGCCA